MKESKLNKACADYLVKRFTPSQYYKHADRFTKGIPDSTFSYNGFTSWLEFKFLGPNEDIHEQLDKLQLVELMKLERATGRAWVVAYRKANPKKLVLPQTVIYAPSALWRQGGVYTPVAREVTAHGLVLQALRVYGVALFEGFDHVAVGTLIEFSHGSY